jgi:Secretion system C-terminal sorting domain
MISALYDMLEIKESDFEPEQIPASRFASSNNLLDDEKIERNINIYPNPSRGIITIQMYDKKITDDLARLILYDSYGNQIKNSKITLIQLSEGISIDLSGYSTGLYHVVINLNNSTFHEKVNYIR